MTDRQQLITIIRATLQAMEPQRLMLAQLRRRGNTLHLGRKRWRLDQFRHIYIIGAGKATYGMAVALEKLLGNRITAGWINVPHVLHAPRLKYIHAHRATHPLPSPRNVFGAAKIMALAQTAGRDDLVIALISGGGSAMLALPPRGIPLTDKIAVTKLLLRTNATIQELNCVRKHLSLIKGGFLANACSPAEVLALQISDVIGDDVGTIASGCLAPDDSTFADAINILQRKRIWQKSPPSIRRYLLAGKAGEVAETPTSQHPCFRRCTLHILANHASSAQAAASAARKLGWRSKIVSTKLAGEACSVGPRFVRQRFQQKQQLFIASGETTVTVKGNGFGGRNQELVLAALPHLKPGMTLASIGTDGADGINPKPVAGALANFSTLQKAQRLRLNITQALARNDSYTALKELGAHIITGPTGTNVGDLQLLFLR